MRFDNKQFIPRYRAETQEHIEKIIKGMGLEVTEETKKKMKEMMKDTNEVMKSVSAQGFSTETHINISSPELSAKDFNFMPPQGAVQKKSLFEGTCGPE